MRKLFILWAAATVGMAPAALGSFISEIPVDVPTLALAVSEKEFLVIADGSPEDHNPATGVVTFTGAIGAWSVNVTTGITEPILPLALMDLNSVDVAGAGNPTLEIWWSDPVVQRPFAPPISFTMDIGGTIGAGTLVYQAFYGAPGMAFDDTNLIGSLSFNASPFSGSTTGAAPGITDPFSLTQLVVINSNAAGATSFNAALYSTPEPAVALLAASGLLALAVVARRRILG